jgi:YidC/Oxa1 family membrane protein insertase
MNIWAAFVGLIEQGLLFFNSIIAGFGIPYSFGFAVILFTVVIKLATFPLNQKQIKASKAQQELQPKLKALQKKHGDDRETMAKAQMDLYKEHGINPLGGCLPTLVQMPVWFGLYRALWQLASQPDTPLQEGFFWIPSLAGPVTPEAGGFSGGIEWILPGDPAFLGWASVIAYMVLPILLVVSQLYTQRMMMPKTDDPQQKMMGQIMSFMPLMFGYFALVVPSGLSLYWLTSNILSMGQQYFFVKQGEKDEAEKKEKNQENISDEQLEVSPATAAVVNNPPDSTNGQVNANERRRSRSRKRRKRKK